MAGAQRFWRGGGEDGEALQIANWRLQIANGRGALMRSRGGCGGGHWDPPFNARQAVGSGTRGGSEGSEKVAGKWPGSGWARRGSDGGEGGGGRGGGGGGSGWAGVEELEGAKEHLAALGVGVEGLVLVREASGGGCEGGVGE